MRSGAAPATPTSPLMSIDDQNEETTNDDRSYRGSRFSEVQDALFAEPYQFPWGAPDQPGMPRYVVSLRRFAQGILPFGKPFRFWQAAARTVDSFADMRWGKDGKGFRRLVHPNGVCLTGLWEITEDTGYSGYFSKGSRALIVGRYSICCTEPRRGYTRSLSLVGKLYPTTDPDHKEPLRTANFITQQDFGGEHTDYINDAVTHNAPDTRSWRRGWGFPILILTGLVLKLIDKEATIRELYEISELGKPKGEPTRTPRFMRLRVAPNQPRIEGDKLDFRDEIMAHIYDKGDPDPKRTLTFEIDVTDEGTQSGLALFERRQFSNWKTIGRITFDRAAASYSGDHVIHFHHPKWRGNRNDVSTVLRVNERRVR
jgi:hypothetical protein